MTTIPRGSTSVMAQRREPPAALDYFPTPLRSTRALFRHVLPAIGAGAISGCRAVLTHANDQQCSRQRSAVLPPLHFSSYRCAALLPAPLGDDLRHDVRH
jgi:hypothetical protein